MRIEASQGIAVFKVSSTITKFTELARGAPVLIVSTQLHVGLWLKPTTCEHIHLCVIMHYVDKRMTIMSVNDCKGFL